MQPAWKTTRSPFVGREEDLAALTRLLEASPDSVHTVVGTAGLGKTRLSRELAASFDPHHFISLVDVSDPDDVTDRVVAGCGLAPTGRDDLGRLTRRLHLYKEPILVVLDNGEHVIDSLGPIAETIAAIDDVRVIVTSRQPLGVRNESVYRLGALDEESSVALLRSLAVDRGVQLQESEVLGLARALEGVPLAIELAAERTTILSPAQIQSRLRESNRVLARASGDRHGSLDLALQHSWVHLSEAQRHLCMRLAVFDHDLTAQRVGELWPEVNAAQDIQSLHARSWISETTEGGVYQIHMLRAVRYFVRELTPRLEVEAVRDQVVAWAVDHLKQDREWWGTRVAEGLFAVHILRDRGQTSTAAELTYRLFLGAGYGFQTRQVLQSAVELIDELDPDRDGTLICNLASRVSGLTMVYAYGSEPPSGWSARALKAAPSNELRMMALTQHSRALFDEARREEAAQAAREGYEIFRSHGPGTSDQLDVSSWLLGFSTVFHCLGEVDRSLEMSAGALKFAKKSFAQARCISQEAFLYFDIGRFEDCEGAIRRTEEALRDAPASEALVTLNVLPPYVHIIHARYQQASEYLSRAVLVAKQSANRGLHYFCDRASALLEMAQGKPGRAFLEHAYSEMAQVDNNVNSLRESAILLALEHNFSGEYARAREVIARILQSQHQNLHGDPVQCEKMLRAALRFAEKMELEHSVDNAVAQPSLPQNAFERLTSAAIASVQAGDSSLLTNAKNETNLQDLMVPGFFLFRFEFHLELWVKAEIQRRFQPVLQVEADARRFVIEGVFYDFSRKSAMRKALLCLARRATAQQSSTVTADELLRECWPDESLDPHTAQNRLSTTMTRLKDVQGLARHIERRPDGYAIADSLRIEWVQKVPAN